MFLGCTVHSSPPYPPLCRHVINLFFQHIFSGGCGYGSESEGEETMESNVTLPQSVPGRGNIKSQKSAIRLTEVSSTIKYNRIKKQLNLERVIKM